MLVPRFHLITPVTSTASLCALIDAGVEAVQVRDKSADDRRLLAFVRACVAALAPRGGRVIVNDRVDLALAGGADGVHLGSDDLPVAAARALAPGLLIGATCRSAAEAATASADGADYAGFGPVWATASKDGLPAPLGTSAIASAAGFLPLIAIGGIDAARAAVAVAAGAHGVAVIGAVVGAVDPPGAARQIATALRIA